MFRAEKFIEKTAKKIREKVDGKALIAFSGGVDSSVCAALVNKAIGDDLVAVHVDTGFMRKNECEEVKKSMEKMGLNYRFIDAKNDFYSSLKNVVDPEEKRKIIGEKFIRIFEEVAEEENIKYLVQGTIAPDWIESGDELRDTIKSHHNVGGLPDRMNLEIVEPLRDLYKDEVRKVADKIDLDISHRQPFPGPGLAIRVMGEATPERVEIVRESCAIVEEEIEKAADEDAMSLPWQYFAVLLPVKSVGVHGDKRVYGEVIVVRVVESVDAMTCSFSQIPYEVMDNISTRITNRLGDKINRVVYDTTNKPPGTIEWE
ncbi:MAG: glutamine-hydrolyzing GMP synthase [Candidatus Thermoplasmatota archaeon]